MTSRPKVLGYVSLALCVAVGVACGTTKSTATTSTTTPPIASADPGYSSGRQDISLSVDGTARTAMLAVPADLSQPAPLVFAFHGHGGSGQNFEKKMNIEGLWPGAIVVYPDGLAGHKGRTDPAGTETGWQTSAGEGGDADIAFYDALLADLQTKLPVDTNRIYLMGHSNGSGFMSLLFNMRGDAIAATANMSGQPGKFLETDPTRSMFMSMGESDPIVSYDNQRKSVPLAEAKLGVDPSTATVDGYLRTERGRGNLQLAVYDYPGGHEPPPEVPPLIVAFFQRHTLSGG